MKYPKMQQKMKAKGGEEWAPTSIDIKVPNRFKYRQNAQFTTLVFMFYSAVPNRFKYHQNACLRDINCFHFFGRSNPFQQPSGVRMHSLETLFSKGFLQFQNRFKYHQNACLRDVALHIFCAVPNRFKYRQSAFFRDIVAGSPISRTFDLIIW